MLKFVIIPTERDTDDYNHAFYESEPLGDRIGTAIKVVWDGKNLPSFMHITPDGNCGHIVISSENVTNEQAKAAIDEWCEAGGCDTDDAVMEIKV